MALKWNSQVPSLRVLKYFIFVYIKVHKRPLTISLNNKHIKSKGPYLSKLRVVSRSAEQKQEVYYPRVSAEAEDVRDTIRGFGVLI